MSTEQAHVVYIITKLELGGAQKICLSLLNKLPEHGINTMLISGKQGLLVSDIESLNNIILIDSLKRELSFTGLIEEIKNLASLIKHLKVLNKKYKNLIVHTHSTKAGLVGRWAAFFARIPYRVHTIHGFAFHKHQSPLITAVIYMCELITSFITTHFVCVSSHDVDLGKKLFPQFNKKHSIIRAAVSWKEFNITHNNKFSKNSSFIFGTVACFKKQKNIIDLLQAFAYVHEHNPHTRLEIIGDGTLRFFIEQWINKHNLKNVITLHGWQKYVAPIMSTWHSFVLSSLWEGLPCAVVEARLLKLPVLSYNTGGIKDVINSGHNGFLYKQKDWCSLAQGMLELSQDEQLYEKLTSATDQLEDFNDQMMIKKHSQLYNKLIE